MLATGVAGHAIAAPPAQVPDLGDAVRRVIDRTNRLRGAVKLAQTTASTSLAVAAQAYAEHMARTERFDHDADGRQPSQRAQGGGYAGCKVTENIAYRTNPAGFAANELADGLVEGWAQSAGHRLNMLDPDVVDTGVAVAHSPRTGRYYAVQMFGRPVSRLMRYKVTNEAAQAAVYAVGERRYSLLPRTANAHEECTADRLRLWSPSDTAASLGEGLTPMPNANYAIQASGGTLRLVKD